MIWLSATNNHAPQATGMLRISSQKKEMYGIVCDHKVLANLAKFYINSQIKVGLKYLIYHKFGGDLEQQNSLNSSSPQLISPPHPLAKRV